jgi:hypothetical protein
MTHSLQWKNGWGTIHPIPGMSLPLLARGERLPILKELDLGANLAEFSSQKTSELDLATTRFLGGRIVLGPAQ